MTNAELRILANGGTIPSSAASQAVVVGNGGTLQQGTCLTCDDNTGCNVAPTEATTLNVNNIQGSTSQVIRYNVDLTGVSASLFPTLNIPFGSDLAADKIIETGLASLTPNIFQGAGSLVNGVQEGRPIAYFNGISAMGGGVICSLTIRFDNTFPGNASLDNLTLQQIQLPFNPQNSPIVAVIYDPFCDACFNTGNGNFTTHKYTLNSPISWWNVLNIPAPAGSKFILEICTCVLGLPNTQQAPTSSIAIS